MELLERGLLKICQEYFKQLTLGSFVTCHIYAWEIQNQIAIPLQRYKAGLALSSCDLCPRSYIAQRQ